MWMKSFNLICFLVTRAYSTYETTEQEEIPKIMKARIRVMINRLICRFLSIVFWAVRCGSVGLPPSAIMLSRACDASLCVRSLGFSVKQVIMPVPVSLSDTRTRARNTLRQSLLSHLLVWILFFLISEEFVNNLIYISLMSGIHRNNL